jgi:hypothetical protein
LNIVLIAHPFHGEFLSKGVCLLLFFKNNVARLVPKYQGGYFVHVRLFPMFNDKRMVGAKIEICGERGR